MATVAWVTVRDAKWMTYCGDQLLPMGESAAVGWPAVL